MKRIRYNPGLKLFARKLRNESTQTEIMMWNALKNKQLCGYDFHRQKPIGNYIVDFFCYKLMLAIEVDGDSHIFKEEKDIKRQNELENMGIRFLRFDDMEVRYGLDTVCKTIEQWIIKNK